MQVCIHRGSKEIGGSCVEVISGGKLPEPLDLFVTCVMPSSVKNNDTSFSNKVITTGKDTFNLNYIYFDKEDNVVGRIETSLKLCIAKSLN